MPSNTKSLDRPVGELWVELTRDEKQKICNALIDRNQPDVLQDFASLVRFVRGYLNAQPSGSQSASGGKPSAPSPSARHDPAPQSGARYGPKDEIPDDERDVMFEVKHESVSVANSSSPPRKKRKAPTT